MHGRPGSGCPYKILTVSDEHTCESLCVTSRLRMSPIGVLEAHYSMILELGRTVYIRSDDCLEFTTAPLQVYLIMVCIKPIRIY